MHFEVAALGSETVCPCLEPLGAAEGSVTIYGHLGNIDILVIYCAGLRKYSNVRTIKAIPAYFKIFLRWLCACAEYASSTEYALDRFRVSNGSGEPLGCGREETEPPREFGLLKLMYDHRSGRLRTLLSLYSMSAVACMYVVKGPSRLSEKVGVQDLYCRIFIVAGMRMDSQNERQL